MHPQDLLLAMFKAAVDAAHAGRCVPPHLPRSPPGRVVVVGAGKGAAEMARAVEDQWHERVSGEVVTRYGHGVPCRFINVAEAGHPIPDAAGLKAASRMLERVKGLGEDDLVLGLWSGGGSSLLALPAPGLTLADKRAINQQLLKSGAAIAEINCVRKHLSAIKGGRLAVAAYPARVLSLIISDVPGDDPSVIASGPTAADPSTRQQALQILEHYQLPVPQHVSAWLGSEQAETPKAGEPRLSRTTNQVIATPLASLQAAAAFARQVGVQALILGDAIEGDAVDCARLHAGMAIGCAAHANPLPAPCVLISGGETTVAVRAGGRGGRNAHFLLALALALRSHPRIWAIACDTDGIDGTEQNAGARLSPDSLSRALDRGLQPELLLQDNDSYRFFDTLNDLIVTGPTRTNVNDFRAILIDRSAP